MRLAVFELGEAKLFAPKAIPVGSPTLIPIILKVAKSTYQSLYGKEPEVKAIHAGR